MTEDRRNELLLKLKKMADCVKKYEEAADRENEFNGIHFTYPFMQIVNNKVVHMSVRVISGIEELAEAAGTYTQSYVSNNYYGQYFTAYDVVFLQEKKIEESKEND